MKITATKKPLSQEDLADLSVADIATVYFFQHKEPALHKRAYEQATHSAIKRVMNVTVVESEEDAIEWGRMEREARKEWLIKNLTDRQTLTDILGNYTLGMTDFREEIEKEGDLLPRYAVDMTTPVAQAKDNVLADRVVARLSPLVRDKFSNDIYRHKNGIWCQLEDGDITQEVISIYREANSTFSNSRVNAIASLVGLIVKKKGDEIKGLIGFLNGVLNIRTQEFSAHSPYNWLTTHNGIMYSDAQTNETLPKHAPNFHKWLNHATEGSEEMIRVVEAVLYMVLANRFDWQLFVEITGRGGSGKSVLANILTLLAGRQNTESGEMNTLDDARERAIFIDKRLIILPDQKQYIGNGSGLKSITGGDSVRIDPKYKKPFSAVIRAVIVAVNNSPMRLTEYNGGMSRRRVIVPFNKVVAEEDRDPNLIDKIAQELPVIVRHLFKKFDDPQKAKRALERQRNSESSLAIKQASDPLYGFVGQLEEAESLQDGVTMGSNPIGCRAPKKYLYHAYLEYLSKHGYKDAETVTAFGSALPHIAEEFGLPFYKKRFSNGYKYKLKLKAESEEWLKG